MQKTKLEGCALSRRGFLKTTGVAAGALSLSSLSAMPAMADEESATQAEVEEEVFFQSCMGNCSGWGCPLHVHVRDGKVVNITKPKLTMPDGSLCPYQQVCAKGFTNIERMYSPTRVQYPLKRAEGTDRGAGEWERISWDQAITEITDKWKELQKEFGPASVAFFSGSGSGMATISYTSRLSTLMGAMSIAPAYDNTGMFCQWEHCGFHTHVNGHNEHRDIANSKNIFIWGTNPSEALTTDYHMISEAQAAGTKIICIDPIFTTTAAHADLYVPIRNATDGLLACAMAQIAIRDGFQDDEHLKTMTVAPFLVKEDGLYLRLSDLGEAEAGSADDRILVWNGTEPVAFDVATDVVLEGEFEVEGKKVQTAYTILLDRLNQWDLKTISEYTDIPLETIEELAAIYVDGPTMIFTGFGPDHYSNGQTAYDAMWALMDITGMEAKHGAGCCCTDFSTPVAQGVVNVATTDLTDAVPGPTIHAPHFHDLMEEGSLGTLEQAPKSVYIYICNPIGNEPDRLKWLKSFEAMEMIVVSDMFMSETATYADYVLPVAFLFERTDLTGGQNPFVKLVDKAVEPQGESKGDFDIITELGRAMGFEDKFTMTEEEFLEACVTNDAAAAAGITWDRLKEEHAIFSYPEEPVVIGLTTPPYTATGRFEFYHEGIQPMAPYAVTDWDMKKESCWFWEPPLEAWHENPLAEKYPLIFISERPKLKTHTMFNNAPTLLEIDPEPYVKMNPADAEARDIAEGDIVRLFNDRGDVTLKAVINSGCRPGVLVIDHGWEEKNFIAGHYSNLSSCASWPRHAQDNWFDCLCEMEKIS